MSHILCPQNYLPDGMRAKTCTRCTGGWNRAASACQIETGAEHLLLAQSVPDCPIQDRCQHQIQAGASPCPVRARGMVCESALIEGGMSLEAAASYPTAFNAEFVITVEEFNMERA